MKTLEDQMGFYAAYHQDGRNKATHFIGVPAIMLSLFIPLAWIRLEVGGVTLTAAIFFAAEVFFALGFKGELHRNVQQRAREMRNRTLTPISVQARAERG